MKAPLYASVREANDVTIYTQAWVCFMHAKYVWSAGFIAEGYLSVANRALHFLVSNPCSEHLPGISLFEN